MSATPRGKQALPKVSAVVLTETVDGLPGRLRKKIDETAALAAGWPVAVTVTEDRSEYTITVDEATTVTLTAISGVVRTTDAVSCGCLLAPKCLHRAGVLACAPVDDGTGQEAEVSEAEPAVGPARETGPARRTGRPRDRPGDARLARRVMS